MVAGAVVVGLGPALAVEAEGDGEEEEEEGGKEEEGEEEGAVLGVRGRPMGRGGGHGC